MIIGSKVIYHDELPSTNSEAARLLRETELSEGEIIRAGFQTAGRGHGNNGWISDKDMNLLFSIILHPEVLDPTAQFYISIAISLGIHDFISKYCSNVSIKWPNDIYVGSDKIAGILIENTILGNTIQNSIAGIGININQDDFHSLAPNPVSLKMKTGMLHDTERCFQEVTECIGKRYRELLWGDNERLQVEYVSKLYRLNKWAEYRSESKQFTARLTGINNEGRLILVNQDQTISEFGFKEVEYISDPQASH